MNRQFLSRQSARKLMYGLGTLLLVASLFFVVFYVRDNWQQLHAVEIEDQRMLLLAIFWYAASHITTALSWPMVLRRMSVPISMRDGLQIGLIAQIGKYLPGNVAHYFGRATIASQLGISLTKSGASTAVEIVSALAASALVGGSALIIEPDAAQFLVRNIADAYRAAYALLILLFAGAAMLAFYLYRKRYSIQVVLAPTFLLAISFLLSGISFAALMSAIGWTVSFPTLIAVFVVAWAIGFVVPGAPAGLGVRETILISFLAPEVGPTAALACSLLHRILTAGVDALAAIAGYAWLRLSKKKKSANDVLSGSLGSQG